MKIWKQGGSLAVVIPKEIGVVEGQEVEWVYSDEIGAYCLVKSEDWKHYISLESVSDKELYERYKAGRITCSGLGGYRVMKRIEDYIERTKRKVIDRELKQE